MRDCDIQPLIADTVRSCRCIRNSSGVFAAASRLRRCILLVQERIVCARILPQVFILSQARV